MNFSSRDFCVERDKKVDVAFSSASFSVLSSPLVLSEIRKRKTERRKGKEKPKQRKIRKII